MKLMKYISDALKVFFIALLLPWCRVLGRVQCDLVYIASMPLAMSANARSITSRRSVSQTIR